MPSPEATIRTSRAVVVGVVIRDPNVHEIILALLRLNRMPEGGPASRTARVEVGAATPGTPLLVGYISSAEDAEYFQAALHDAGDPPSAALVPRTTGPRLIERVERMVTKVVLLPDDAQVIAEAIREQLMQATAAGRNLIVVTPLAVSKVLA
jgi:hypothetical protein